MNKKHTLNLLYIFTFIFIYFSIYTSTISYATISFDINISDSKHSNISGQVFYSDTAEHHSQNSIPFLLRGESSYGIYQNVIVPINKKTFKYIRLDPLPNTGEFIIKNFTILQGSWFNEETQIIDLSKIDMTKIRNIKILEQETNHLHLLATGVDPHFEITSDAYTLKNLFNYKIALLIFLCSIFIVIIIKALIEGLITKYITISDIIALSIIILYSIYTFFFAIHHDFAQIFLIYIPYLLIFLIYTEGFFSYSTSLKVILIILFSLTLLTLLIDYMIDVNMFNRYQSYFINILASLIIPIIFIRKKNFNRLFYKYFLFYFTLIGGIILTFVHIDLLKLDTTLIFGHRISIGPWAQKSHSFWYILLMWSTISFFHFSKDNKFNIIAIVLLLITSSFTIFTSYSESAKLSFILSLLIYLLFTFKYIHLRIMMSIPILISLYILLTPWISDLFTTLSSIHPRLASREPLFSVYSSLIKENLLFGYGFNSCISLTPSDYLTADLLQKYAQSRYINICSPHTLPLVIWLNFGFIGALLVSILAYYGVKKIILTTYLQHNNAPLLALISSFIIITAFSWGSWYPYSLSYYSMFIGLILLSLNQNKHT